MEHLQVCSSCYLVIYILQALLILQYLTFVLSFWTIRRHHKLYQSTKISTLFLLLLSWPNQPWLILFKPYLQHPLLILNYQVVNHKQTIREVITILEIITTETISVLTITGTIDPPLFPLNKDHRTTHRTAPPVHLHNHLREEQKKWKVSSLPCWTQSESNQPLLHVSPLQFLPRLPSLHTTFTPTPKTTSKSSQNPARHQVFVEAINVSLFIILAHWKKWK